MGEKESNDEEIERERDELLKRLWKMPPKPHAELKKKAKRKRKKKTKHTQKKKDTNNG